MPVFSCGQVYLTGTGSNPAIKDYLEKHPGLTAWKSSVKTYQSIYPPFKDDFSFNSIYPDTTKWTDIYAYINAQYPIFPVDYGVATMDVLNSEGDIYSYASTFPFAADYLTSFPLRLDSVFDENHNGLRKTTAADSIYLSFYYQPQGLGDVPLPNDSLVLQFGHYTDDTVFSHVEYIWLRIDALTDSLGEPLGEGDTIFAGDKISNFGCDFDTVVATRIYIYTDSIYVPCDSVFIVETEWENVWAAGGQAIDSFLVQNNVYFKRVMIPITDTAWLRSDFQFRFFNYGSLSVINSWKSNTDHWHIDKVYLATGRSMNDIYTGEIRFVRPAHSLLSPYTSIPMWHYDQDMMADTITVYANNLDSIGHSCTYTYTVQDESGEFLPGFNYPGFTDLMEPFVNLNINSYSPFANIPVNSYFDYLDTDSANYTVNQVVLNNDEMTVGDTIQSFQRFSNYFAYDDGTAERSYGASSDNTKMVVQFRTYTTDTLRGVQIYFNKVQGDYNLKNFDIGVWSDNNGKPGTLVDTMENKRPVFLGTGEFSTYLFSDIIRMGVDVFYIGVTQKSNDNLNIGFDKNTNSKSRTFYNTDGQWVNSPFDGSLMIRPLFGKALADTGVTTKSYPSELKVYPNPAGDIQFVNLVLPGDYTDPNYKKYLTLRIFDLYGRKIYSAQFNEYLDISRLDSGFYIIDIFDAAYTRHYTTKMLVEKK